MNRWKKAVVSRSTNLMDTIRIIDESGIQIALVLDNNGCLLGTVTDGDIRRGLLRGVQLSEKVLEVMNCKPITIEKKKDYKEAQKVMEKLLINQLPIVDDNNTVVGIHLLGETQICDQNIPVVLMVGGYGRRLGSLTKEVPKPMLKIGEKPILQRIIDNFVTYGFQNFILSVNYKAEVIEDYFKDGKELGVHIDYIKEEKDLGTAGSLSLVRENINTPIIVMNGDLLTKINFYQLLQFHKENNAMATMSVREYDVNVPFGVIQVEDNKIKSIDEKPVHKFFVNAGIYVVERQALEILKYNEYCDMPNFFEMIKNEFDSAYVFPVHEYWLDIGRTADYQKASSEFNKNFIVGEK